MVDSLYNDEFTVNVLDSHSFCKDDQIIVSVWCHPDLVSTLEPLALAVQY